MKQRVALFAAVLGGVLLAMPVALAVEDPYEPNNDKASATTLAENTWLSDWQGTANGTDGDWYEIVVPESEHDGLFIECVRSDGSWGADMTLYPADGGWISYVWDGVPNDTLLHPVEAGTYYLELYGGYEEYDLRWTLVDLPPNDPYEPNNSPTEWNERDPKIFLPGATLLSEYDSLGIVGYSWDLDVHGFNIPEGHDKAFVECLFSMNDADLDMEVYNKNVQQVGSSYSGTDNEFVFFDVSSADSPYIATTLPYAVAPFFAESNITYDLRWFSWDSTAYDANDSAGDAMPLPEGTALSEGLGNRFIASGNEDWFSIVFDAAQGNGIVLEATYPSAYGSLLFEVYNSDEQLVGVMTKGELLSFALGESGTYYIRVNNEGGTNVPYDLSWTTDNVPTLPLGGSALVLIAAALAAGARRKFKG